MSTLKTPMDILRLLDQSNCRQCNEPTCMAFAAQVFKGKKKLSECPKLDASVIEKYSEGDEAGEETKKPRTSEEEIEAYVEELKSRVRQMDLSAVAEKLGGDYENNRLTVKVLGKNFRVYQDGTLSADIHTNPWVSVPVLTYITEGAGRDLTGNWLPFRELKNGSSWYGLFRQRCEKPLKQIADNDYDLFVDLLDVFNGIPTEHLDADIARVFYVLPKAAIMICYWPAEEDFESNLSIYFDAAVEQNLNIASINALGSGLARMFEKLAQKHSTRQPFSAAGL
ncbi:MAG: DUF3786 domain-containing protein [Thermodesulfobacteriota bacterium]